MSLRKLRPKEIWWLAGEWWDGSELEQLAQTHEEDLRVCQEAAQLLPLCATCLPSQHQVSQAGACRELPAGGGNRPCWDSTQRQGGWAQ